MLTGEEMARKGGQGFGLRTGRDLEALLLLTSWGGILHRLEFGAELGAEATQVKGRGGGFTSGLAIVSLSSASRASLCRSSFALGMITVRGVRVAVQ
jgi:hypothetical protein